MKISLRAIAATFALLGGVFLTPLNGQETTQAAAPAAANILTYQQYPRYYYSYGDQTRNPKFTLLFNSEMVAATAQTSLFFEDSEERAVPAAVRASTQEEIAEHWKYYGGNDQLSPPANRFLTVTPTRLLPAGEYWKLVITENLTDKNKQLKVARRESIGAGSVVPFTVNNAEIYNPYNEKPSLNIYLSKSVSEKEADALLDRYVRLTPRPEGLALKQEGTSITLTGQFNYGQEYLLQITAGLLAKDELTLDKQFEKKLVMSPREPFITLPDYDLAQPRNGEGAYRILMGNLANAHVRVKQLDGPSLIYALRGYQIYKNDNKYPFFDMVPGKTVMDEKVPAKADIDKSEDYGFNWSKIVAKGQSAQLYLCVEGDSREHPNLGFQRVGAQSIVQLTDLGVAWKRANKDALAYVFSLSTGKPVGNATVTLYDNENIELSKHVTGVDGVARFPLTGGNEKTGWMIANTVDDRYALKFDAKGSDGISTWQFDVRQPYYGEPRVQLRTYVFSDRDIYKPGETVHLKAIARLADGDRLAIPNKDAGFPAQVKITDGQGRELLDQVVKFSAHGTADLDFQVPTGNYGGYQVQIDFDDILKPMRSEEDEDYDRYAYHTFTVADYRPNTFEIAIKAPDAVNPGEAVKVPVQANYYRGKPLSKASMNWHASFRPSHFSPAGFDGFTFGEWSSENGWTSEANTTELNPEGKAEIDLSFIPVNDLEQPVNVTFNADVTDINQQTISESASFLVHSSDYYLGLKLPSTWLNTGDKVPVEFLPVTRDGKVRQGEVDAKLIVERKVWSTLKVQGAGDQIRHRNEWILEPVSETPIKITTGADLKPVQQTFTFDKPGSYKFTLETTEPSGKKIKTVSEKYVYGDNDVWWAQRDGEIIELVTEKEDYKVGDTAKILVRSPILGNALITTERAGVYTTFTTELTSKSQFIEIPITDKDAPNLFVSVVIVRGSNLSEHQYKNTDYRIGYCELQVERPSDHLKVNVEVAQKEIIPQQDVDVVATVLASDGKPVTGSEVTLYAVDEGVLSLTGYQTPDPSQTFLAAYPLFVQTWHTLFDVLSEDPKEREFSNKGLLIGGGAEGSSAMFQKTRKDFRATAFWHGSLITDENGQVKAQFKAPDSLTEYRVIAVALADTQQYGTGTSKMTVTKPVIVEPALPAFSNIGDDVILQAVVHNTTAQPGTFEVTLQADDHIQFLANDFKLIPAALTPAAGPQTWKETIELAPNSTHAFPIPVKFTKPGEAKWTWSIKESNAAQSNRVDNVESTLQVGYPVPLLGEVQHLPIKPGESRNLLASFKKDLLDGLGEIDVTISNSRLLEAQDALEYNLHYPYGCIEQTTSSTLPWLTMNTFSKVFPDMKAGNAAERQKAIDYGLNRILSMQTAEGGLSYWPGEHEPMVWGSAYGGVALAIGYRQGQKLPEARLNLLWTWLSEHIRGAEEENSTYDLHQRCLGLYALALAGKAEPAYHEVLYNKAKSLAPESRALLALAILEAGAPEQKVLATSLLAMPNTGKEESTFYGYGKTLETSIQLMAYTKLDANEAKTTELLDNLLKQRRPAYGWGSTYSNAWPLLALSKLAEKEANPIQTANFNLAWGDTNTPFTLGNQLGSQSAHYSFEGDMKARELKLSTTGAQLYAHVRVNTRPKAIAAQPQDQGFKLRRQYLKLSPDGQTEPATSFAIGDLVVVDLELEVPKADDYLAIDDPLPAVFEAINPAFTNRANAEVPVNGWEQLPRSHEEIRSDRALFFCDNVWNAGKYKIQYLARVVASGAVTAPPAKVEAMYEPQRYGLSATSRIVATMPAKEGAQVAAK